MEILVVLLTAYFLGKSKSRLSSHVHRYLQVSTVTVFLLICVGYTVLTFPESLYTPIGFTRQTNCEEILVAYKQALDEKDPDDLEDEIKYQAHYEALSNPINRVKYEYYGRTEEDAALKDLFRSLPFYIGGFILSYGLTCSKETLTSGKWGIIILVLLLSIEWQAKSDPQPQAQYDSLPFTRHQQIDILKSFFYPVLLALYIYSQSLFYMKQTSKRLRNTR